MKKLNWESRAGNLKIAKTRKGRFILFYTEEGAKWKYESNNGESEFKCDTFQPVEDVMKEIGEYRKTIKVEGLTARKVLHFSVYHIVMSSILVFALPVENLNIPLWGKFLIGASVGIYRIIDFEWGLFVGNYKRN